MMNASEGVWSVGQSGWKLRRIVVRRFEPLPVLVHHSSKPRIEIDMLKCTANVAQLLNRAARLELPPGQSEHCEDEWKDASGQPADSCLPAPRSERPAVPQTEGQFGCSDRLGHASWGLSFYVRLRARELENVAPQE